MVLLEGLLSGDQGCTWQGQTHEDHGQSFGQQGGGLTHYLMVDTQSGKETPENFTGFISWDLGIWSDHRQAEEPNLGEFLANREDWELSGRVINLSKIRWAIHTFKPFKSTEANEIVPALLQQGTEQLVANVCHIFRACLARGYISKAWRLVKVTFIPEPRKNNYTEAKAYRPSCWRQKRKWCRDISGTRY
jgi:hypothetical protein